MFEINFHTITDIVRKCIQVNVLVINLILTYDLSPVTRDNTI